VKLLSDQVETVQGMSVGWLTTRLLNR
jgi:hypothetical protein